MERCYVCYGFIAFKNQIYVMVFVFKKNPIIIFFNTQPLRHVSERKNVVDSCVIGEMYVPQD